jgi:hypothetical protein
MLKGRRNLVTKMETNSKEREKERGERRKGGERGKGGERKRRISREELSPEHSPRTETSLSVKGVSHSTLSFSADVNDTFSISNRWE